MQSQRVVVTGLGVISAIGNTVDQYWNGLVSGKSGIRNITRFDASNLPCQVAAEVVDFDPGLYMDKKSARRSPRFAQFAMAATRQAVEDAGLTYPFANGERVGVYFGTAIGGVEQLITANEIYLTRGYDRIPPLHLPSGIPNLPAFIIAQEFNCLGQNNTTTTACAAGTQAVCEGAEWIRHGKADVVITGGTEAIILGMIVGAFSAMRALPTSFNQHPEQASRPFDALREGFVIGEGCASLILESLDHATRRGARIYAEYAGQSSSSDAYDLAALQPDGLGAIRSMGWALKDAQVTPEAVDYINAHGTSTLLNDRTETLAIKKLFGEHAFNLAVSSTKSMLGHAMGASGALEAVATTLAIYNNVIPPTINYQNPDPDCDLYYVPNHAIHRTVNIAISNSFGLGGQNATLVLKKFPMNA